MRYILAIAMLILIIAGLTVITKARNLSGTQHSVVLGGFAIFVGVLTQIYGINVLWIQLVMLAVDIIFGAYITDYFLRHNRQPNKPEK